MIPKTQINYGILLFYERKEIFFYKFSSNKFILCNEFQREDILTNFSLIKKSDIYNDNIYGYIEY